MYMKPKRRTAALGSATMVACLLVAGCIHPGRLDPSVVGRYQRTMSDKGPQLRERADVLGALRPAPGATGPLLQSTRDEQGREVIPLSLQEAVMRGLANNLDIRVISYQPDISHTEMVRAAAAFDVIFFGGASIAKQDEFLALSAAESNRREQRLELGVRQTTITGGEWSVTGDFNYDENRSASPTIEGYTPSMTLAVTQPLLRGAWPQRNLATLRIARINHKISMAAFRQQVEQTSRDIMVAYWQLVQARRNRDIQASLLDASIKTLKRIQDRMKLDATAVQVKQAETAVEQRRAQLLRADKSVHDAQDALGRLLSDSQINVLTDAEILPTDSPADVEVAIDELDQLMTALRFNPQLEQARLAIGAARINVSSAESDELPRVDLTGSMVLDARGETLYKARKSFFSSDHVSWSLGLVFEYPLGNRAAEALTRQRRLEHLQSITQLQQSADQVAQVVRERIREARTAFQEILVQRLAAAAARDQLKALEDTERIRGALTPEFLQVKLAAQDTVAFAEQALIAAIVNYNIAMVDVNLAAGTVLEMNRVKVAMPAIPDSDIYVQIDDE